MSSRKKKRTVACAAAYYFMLSAEYLLLQRQERKRRRWWMVSLYRSRTRYNATDMLQDLRQEPSGYFENFCRISASDFEYFVNKLGPVIAKKNTSMRESIPIQERLAVTLRFMATGDSFKSLSFLFKFSVQTVSRCVEDVCKALINELKDEIKRLQEGNTHSTDNENTEENDGNKSDDDGSTENVVDPEIPTTSTKLSGNQGRAFKSPTSSGHKRKRKAETMTTIESRMDEAYQVFKNLSKAETTDSDECSLYAELLAKKLRALDENTRGIAMLEIDHLMYRLKQSNNFIQRPPPFIQTYPYPSSAQNFPQNIMQNYYQPPPGYPSAIPFANYSQQSSSPSLSSHSPSSAAPSPQSHIQQSDEKDSFKLNQDSTEAEGREQLSLDLDTLINL